MISILFIFLASLCNSIMDKTSHHFHKSIFKNLNPVWWNAEISWKNKYILLDPKNGRRKLLFFNYPVQLTDAWHFFKTLMIIFICLAIIFYQSIFNWYFDLLIFGTCWNLTFSLFYSYLFKNLK